MRDFLTASFYSIDNRLVRLVSQEVVRNSDLTDWSSQE